MSLAGQVLWNRYVIWVCEVAIAGKPSPAAAAAPVAAFRNLRRVWAGAETAWVERDFGLRVMWLLREMSAQLQWSPLFSGVARQYAAIALLHRSHVRTSQHDHYTDL